MNNPPPVQFAAESSRQRLLRVLQPDYLVTLLRNRWRWVAAVMTLCVGLGIYWALQSPTYQARVVIEAKGVCPHGFLTNSFSISDTTDYQLCPHCKP